MYYSALVSISPSQHCIGTALSTNVTGPYVPEENVLFCPLERGTTPNQNSVVQDSSQDPKKSQTNAGGAIDASVFEDPVGAGTFIVYKVSSLIMKSGRMQDLSSSPSCIRVELLMLTLDID